METKTYRYTVKFEETEEGIIIATVPALRGCVSYGQSLEEAEKNIQEAIECYIEGLEAIGESIPIEDTPALLSVHKALKVVLSSL